MAIDLTPSTNLPSSPSLERRPFVQQPTPQSCFREGYPDELEKAEKDLMQRRWARAKISRPRTAHLTNSCIGLALSGGGIRSATFSLGVLQSLASTKKLREIDILSTVSGGGYIGSFLGRLFSRFRKGLYEPLSGDAVDEVEKKLADPYSLELRWLREHGRYVIPNGGGDILTAAAHVVRSWIALHFNLAAVIFGFFCLLAVLRGYLTEYPQVTLQRWEEVENAFNATTHLGLWWSPWTILPVAFAVLVAIPIGVAFWLTQALSIQKKSDSGDLGPLFLAVLWVVMLVIPIITTNAKLFILPLLPALLGLLYFVLFFVASQRIVHSIVPGMPGPSRDLRHKVREKLTEKTTRYFRTKSGQIVMHQHSRFGSIPTMLFKYAALVTIYRRLGKATLDDFWRNYRYPMIQVLTRCRSLLTSWLGTALLIFATLAVVALIDTLGQTFYVHSKLSNHEAWALGGAGGISVVFALLHKFADKLLTPKPETKPGKLQTVVVPALALFLVTAYLTLCALGSHILLWRGTLPNKTPGIYLTPTKAVALSTDNYIQVGADTLPKPHMARARPLRPTIALLWCFLIALVLRNNMGFLNLSSYQQLYAARLARAYLGASNPKRQEDSTAAKAAKRISDPIPGDDCPMYEYRPHDVGGPLHFLNVTINETVSGQSQVEQRDRKGLPMAIGPSALSVGVKYSAITSFHRPPDSFQVDPIRTGSPATFHVFGCEKIHPADPAKVEEASAPRSNSEQHPAEDLRLSNWVGISGAAFSTGTGAHTSLPLSLLTGLANVRLGYWWDCGTDPRKQEGAIPEPLLSRMMTTLGASFPLLTHLINELTGQFHGPARRRWYLSDGGHFENTACYELLRRRLPIMFVCDCGADPDYRFEDLSNLVRKARIDYDTEIEFIDESELIALLTKHGLKSGREIYGPLNSLYREQMTGKGFPGSAYSKTHVAIAKVRYDISGGRGDEGFDSLLVVIKPSLTGDEPLDLLQYHFKNSAFPQEPTSDQFFDEAQWESYRRLGEHIGMQIFDDTAILECLFSAIEEQRKLRPSWW